MYFNYYKNYIDHYVSRCSLTSRCEILMFRLLLLGRRSRWFERNNSLCRAIRLGTWCSCVFASIYARGSARWRISLQSRTY